MEKHIDSDLVCKEIVALRKKYPSIQRIKVTMDNGYWDEFFTFGIVDEDGFVVRAKTK